MLPGWRLKQALRDALTGAVSHIPDLASKVAGARAFLALLRGWSRGQRVRTLRAFVAWPRGSRRSPTAIIAHEYLAEHNQPQTFGEFIAEAGRARLAYLGDLDLWMTLPENFDPEFRRLLKEACGDALLPTEQMIDVLLGREFRRSLLVHEAVAPSLSRVLDRGRIEGLNFIGRMTRDETAETPEATTFIGTDNKKLTLGTPSARRALEALSRAWPASRTFDELVEASEGSDLGGARETRDQIVYMLFLTLTGGFIDARVDPIRAASTIEARPRAPRHCRIDAMAGESVMATLTHDAYLLSEGERYLLPLMDGTRDREALVDALLQRVSAGDMVFFRGGAPVSDQGETAEMARQEVDYALGAFQSAGLLEPT